jgi:TP901 family phage tail tape measure protein
MTAIWNNFYDGSQSVEYYADAISYLGAVTAASNADIAEGMQAFAATANTVGLSFEYGASALTLLRDVTQQSASTIGNSLKTIFARLSSVAQGDTLEDGVDYTKYTKALSQVGVEVVDVNGELRQMDDILDDLGSR